MLTVTSSTREKILNAALDLFSSRGFSKVSVRDIAAEVGIKAASLYNHFESKRDILLAIYEFYREQQRKVAPPLETLLRMAETEPPCKVLALFNYSYPAEVVDTTDRALIIASQEIYADEASERFVRDYLFEPTLERMVPLLKRMMELGKIEPIDINGFCTMMTYYAFSAAVLSGTRLKENRNKWNRDLSMIFSLVKSVEEADAS